MSLIAARMVAAIWPDSPSAVSLLLSDDLSSGVELALASSESMASKLAEAFLLELAAVKSDNLA